MEIKKLEEWMGPAAAGMPYVIAGPCSAESEHQMMSVAEEIARHPAVVGLRAGIWKPRTRPDSFSGVGKPGLQWLTQAAKAHNLLSFTEVANSAHVESALEAGVDVLWIGARTTVSPFTVQEIADALRGVDIPVMVKNPINPDVQLWIGAFERLAQVGLSKLCAVHRGFSWFDKTVYRNDPMWHFAVQLRMAIPGLPVFCDPSHIAGDRDLVPDVVQQAIDMDMCGLMIETHPNPPGALSDPEQQLFPHQLIALLNNLVSKSSSSPDGAFVDQLARLRKEIDASDRRMLGELAARIRLVEELGQFKRDHQVTVLQLKRWEEILRTRSDWARDLGISESFIRTLLEVIHRESLRIQTELQQQSV